MSYFNGDVNVAGARIEAGSTKTLKAKGTQVIKLRWMVNSYRLKKNIRIYRSLDLERNLD